LAADSVNVFSYNGPSFRLFICVCVTTTYSVHV